MRATISCIGCVVAVLLAIGLVGCASDGSASRQIQPVTPQVQDAVYVLERAEAKARVRLYSFGGLLRWAVDTTLGPTAVFVLEGDVDFAENDDPSPNPGGVLTMQEGTPPN